jgi:hypothetical protein
MSGAQTAKRAQETMTSATEHRDTFVDGGEFLPLSVWRFRGFDATKH